MKHIIELAGIKPVDFAKIVGITDSYVSQMLSGNKPKISETLAKLISLEFGIPYQWVLSGEGDAPQSIIKYGQYSDELVDVYICELAGIGDAYDINGQIPEQGGEKFMEIKKFPRELVKDFRYAFQVKGQSMYPMVRSGAYVGIDFKDQDVITGDMYCLKLPYEGYVVKFLDNEPEGIRVRSFNPSIQPYVLPHDYLEQGLVIGRIKWLFQEINK